MTIFTGTGLDSPSHPIRLCYPCRKAEIERRKVSNPTDTTFSESCTPCFQDLTMGRLARDSILSIWLRPLRDPYSPLFFVAQARFIFNLPLGLGHEPFIDLGNIGSDTDTGARLRSLESGKMPNRPKQRNLVRWNGKTTI